MSDESTLTVAHRRPAANKPPIRDRSDRSGRLGGPILGPGWSGLGKAGKLYRMQRLALIFKGQVQGVGFRYATRQVAEGFALTGWVRNEPDGSVRLEVQGEAPEIEAMVRALQERMRGYIRTTDTESMVVAPTEQEFGIRL